MRQFFRDLALIPEIWRGLVDEARKNRAYAEFIEASKTRRAADPEYEAKAAARRARVARDEAERGGQAHLRKVGPL